MKKTILAVFAAFLFTTATAQTANVKKVNGFDIYMFSTPSVPYEELYTVSGFWNWGELFGTNFDNIVNTMTRNATKRQKNHPKATGILFTSKNKGVAIRTK